MHGLSNRAIFNDLEGPQTQIVRSGHSLTLNISKMAADMAIVTIHSFILYYAIRHQKHKKKTNRKPYQSFQMVLLSITLSDP